MKKLNFKKNEEITGGDRAARILKQMSKCEGGSQRACRRMMRMLIREIR